MSNIESAILEIYYFGLKWFLCNANITKIDYSTLIFQIKLLFTSSKSLNFIFNKFIRVEVLNKS